jgi:hypothetical protein
VSKIRHWCKECYRPAKLFYVIHFKYEGDPQEQLRLVARCFRHPAASSMASLVSERDYEVAEVMDS